MPTLPEQIIELLKHSPGMSDREITNALRGASAPQQPVNIAARKLEQKGVVKRITREDGRIGNYITGAELPIQKRARPSSTSKGHNPDKLQEDSIKAVLAGWLESNGWKTTIAWGKARGIDIVATKNDKRWVIEVKGIGSRSEMRVNYFIGILGETLQRMDDPRAKYSIALPDIDQFRGLWERLPHVAKQRTMITALFINEDGVVREDA